MGALSGPFKKLKTGNFIWDRVNDVSLASLSKFLSILMTNPFYMLKTRAESMRFSSSHSVMQDVKDTYRKAGFSGFYNGFWATIIRDVPYQGIQFAIYKVLGELSSSFAKVDTTNDTNISKIGRAL